MSWEDRTNSTIKFTSPTGREFTAYWRGNNRTKEKSLGKFKPPKKKGSIVQDLDVDATIYPIPIIFEGENGDLEASLFFETCSENGIWQIIHPTKGLLSLQLVSVTEKDQPVTSGNMWELDTEWIQPLTEDVIVSTAELAEAIEQQIKTLNQSASDQLGQVSDQTTASRIQVLKDSAGQVASTIKNGLESISNLSAEISNVTNSIQRATTSNLLNPTVAIESLATQIQSAAQLPALASNNTSERFGSYESVITNLSSISADLPNAEGKNVIAMKEIGLVSMVSTLPRIATTGTLSTRTEAVQLAESMSNIFQAMTDSLDEDQEFFAAEMITNRYFSQSSSYADLLRLIALGIKYILNESFDLKIEKRFRIGRDRTPIDITIEEYKSLGDNDENLDFFIATNKLKGEDILLLRAGTEVVVYV